MCPLYLPGMEFKWGKGIVMDDARDLVKKTVLVKLVNDEGLEFVGVPEEGLFFCRVVAVDEVGLWIEHKSFVTTELSDSKGRTVPKKRRRPERHVVNVLLPWRNILTVVMFAEEEADDIVKDVLGGEREGRGKIGFIQ
jgi:hypothetical protein